MEDLKNAVVKQRKKDTKAAIAVSVFFILAIGYFVFSWKQEYPNFSALGIWGLLFCQLLTCFLLIGLSLESRRWPWWKISYLLILAHWLFGVSIGLFMRYIIG